MSDYYVELLEATRHADRIERRFIEDYAKIVGILLFRNNPRTVEQVVLVQFVDDDIPEISIECVNTSEATERIFDDTMAVQTVCEALDISFAKDYDTIRQELEVR